MVGILHFHHKRPILSVVFYRLWSLDFHISSLLPRYIIFVLTSNEQLLNGGNDIAHVKLLDPNFIFNFSQYILIDLGSQLLLNNDSRLFVLRYKIPVTLLKFVIFKHIMKCISHSFSMLHVVLCHYESWALFSGEIMKKVKQVFPWFQSRIC